MGHALQASFFDRRHPDCLSTTLASNNTAELCATVANAMRFLLQGAADDRDVTVFFDSVFVCKMATGQWNPRSNSALVQRVQELVEQVSSMRSRRWQHVYGHTGVEGREKADRAADKGARGEVLWWTRRSVHRRVHQPAAAFLPTTTSELSSSLPSALQNMTWTEFSEIVMQPQQTAFVLHRHRHGTHPGPHADAS